MSLNLKTMIPLALSTACCKPGITKFTAEPPCVCKDHEITLTWSVDHTDPVIVVDHPPAEWPGKPFERSGSRRYHIKENTEFTLTAPGANQANGDGKRRQSVNVVDADTPALASTPACQDTGAERVVAGPMPFSCGAFVTQMRDPIVQSTVGEQVVNAPRKVCLVPPTGSKICVDGGGKAPVNAFVDKTWNIEIPLDASETCAGVHPGLATVKFDLNCDQHQ